MPWFLYVCWYFAVKFQKSWVYRQKIIFWNTGSDKGSAKGVDHTICVLAFFYWNSCKRFSKLNWSNMCRFTFDYLETKNPKSSPALSLKTAVIASAQPFLWSKIACVSNIFKARNIYTYAWLNKVWFTVIFNNFFFCVYTIRLFFRCSK